MSRSDKTSLGNDEVNNIHMKTIFLTTTLLLFSGSVLADKGVVVKKDVCGSGNAIIETTDGWFVAAEHFSGVYLYEGDIVFGDMKTYGSVDLTRDDGESGSFYIEDYESNLGEAYEELCD
ncbi:hypothetical protein [Grimontia sp. NTOU-MAR1]|uniref:hypothetical protein n=1 Tax=Grimontia sp. NTOU-MAR1 TaxID=3111011 RepID=UPI002DB85A45|nr:hypothetical protein [Grimontia sp. NTOU-MAR1]WRV98866.1 hypothetical protein VP504_05435 [Grimontia sp. NTOU-MAR1]